MKKESEILTFLKEILPGTILVFAVIGLVVVCAGAYKAIFPAQIEYPVVRADCYDGCAFMAPIAKIEPHYVLICKDICEEEAVEP